VTTLFLPLLAVPAFLLIFGFIGKTVLRSYQELAGRYPRSGGAPVEPSKWILISFDFGFAQGVRNGFFLSADPAGFYLKPIWLLRWGNPPAFVPWGAVRAKSGRSFGFFRTVEFRFEGLDVPPLRFYGRDWDRALAAFAGVWPERLRRLSWE
jgi:hypothetical protein